MAPNREKAKKAAAKKRRRAQRRSTGKPAVPRARAQLGRVVAEFATRPGRMKLAVAPSMHPKNPPFLEENLELGYMARELEMVRRHNKSFQEGERQDAMLMFCEAGIVLMMMERFLRSDTDVTPESLG